MGIIQGQKRVFRKGGVLGEGVLGRGCLGEEVWGKRKTRRNPLECECDTNLGITQVPVQWYDEKCFHKITLG